MPDAVGDYETAASGFAAVLAQCGDDLGATSPCEGWTAQDIVDHVAGGAPYYTREWGGQVPDIPEDADRAARYTSEYRAFAEACRQPGVLDRMIPSPFGEGEMPAEMMLGIFTADTLIHTWDLARAIGVDVQLDQDLLQRTWDGMVPMEASLRRPDVFGPAIEIDDGAPMQDRAMAWFGRQP
jgi:uncharacterized protein (TIGR03086 family)